VGVPEGVGYASKGELTMRMLGRAFDAAVRAAWVTADWTISGRDATLRDGGEELLRWLEARGQPYVVAEERSGELAPAVEGRLREAPLGDRRHAEAGGGGQPRAWARARSLKEVSGGKALWVLMRRSAANGPERYVRYRAYGSDETTLAELARVAMTGEAAEEDLERVRSEVGLDDYEVRGWEAWHRHVTLCLLAHAALKVTWTREG
jgi:SRSO17 transposase